MIGRLGKLPAVHDPRTLKLAKYVGSLPPAPPVCDWLSGIMDWGEMKNDHLGDCVLAAGGHAIQTWSAATGPIDTLPDSTVEQYYSKWAGYVPGDSATDNGYVELDFLKHWRNESYAGRELVAFASVNPGNIENVKQAITLFGGAYIGLALPITAQTQENWHLISDRGDGEPGSWGLHAVFCPYYDDFGPMCITWGARQRMTWQFWEAYCDESYALLSRTWLDRVPADFHFSNLQGDLAEITG